MSKHGAIRTGRNGGNRRQAGFFANIFGRFFTRILSATTRQSLANGNAVKLLKTKESDMRYPSNFASYCNGDFGGFLVPKALPRNMVESFVCKQLEGLV